MSNVLGYIRVSNPDHPSEKLAETNQRGAIAYYCEGADLPEPTVYADIGVPSNVPLPEREGGSRLLDALEPWDHIVLTRLDRAFRNLYECIRQLKIWADQNVTVHVIKTYAGGPIVLRPDSPEQRLFVALLTAFADYVPENP